MTVKRYLIGFGVAVAVGTVIYGYGQLQFRAGHSAAKEAQYVAELESYTRPTLPGNLTTCTDPQPPTGNHFDDVAVALADAVTRYYECKIKLDTVVGLWSMD